MWQHKSNMVDGFTKKYGLHQLVWHGLHGNMTSAIVREKHLKEWKRAWKLRLIEEMNPEWKDLFDSVASLDSGLRRSDGDVEASRATAEEG